MTVRSSLSKSMQIALNKNNFGAIPKKTNPKEVKINEQPTYHQLPPNKYCIHITRLPAYISAETLSCKFGWNVCDILMDSSMRQCWLKNARDESEIDEFITKWNKKSIGHSTIQCEMVEDQLELCNKFQYGQCTKNDEECDWEHVPCIAQGNCALTCPYGHAKGAKQEPNCVKDSSGVGTYYRIKITGSKTTVPRKKLNGRFRTGNYIVDKEHDRISYVTRIKTMKYAKELMSKWHDKDIDGQTVKCQLELCQRIARASSPSASVDGKRKPHRSRSRPQDTRSLHSRPDTSDVDDLLSISFDNGEAERDRRISGRALQEITSAQKITSAPLKTTLHQTTAKENIATGVQTKYQLPNDLLANKWEITNKATNSIEKLLLIRNKIDRKHLAVIKIYPTHNSDDFNREINAIKELNDVINVSRLIEYDKNREKCWIIMERAPGCSLKQFIERKDKQELEISTAIGLTLHLIKIIQNMHNRGVFHQNLSPENIMIEWDGKSSIDAVQLTLLNFSQSIIMSNRIYTSISASKEKWYQAPQTDKPGLTPTVDSSGVCAILFWLLTHIDPHQDNNDNFPRHEVREKLDSIIRSIVTSISKDQQILAEKQLRKYLNDTFDRAFGYHEYHPWTINNLKCRLESILRLLTPNEPKLITMGDIFKELISIQNSSSTTPVVAYGDERDIFEKASEAFCQAKKYLLQDMNNQFQWTNGNCIWIRSQNSSISKCYHDDILNYSSFQESAIILYRIIVRCLARYISEEHVVALFISSDINGKTIEMPLGKYPTSQDYTIDIQKIFKIEITNLLLAIYNEQKPLQN